MGKYIVCQEVTPRVKKSKAEKEDKDCGGGITVLNRAAGEASLTKCNTTFKQRLRKWESEEVDIWRKKA